MRRLRDLLPGSLFVKVYLTLLACLALVAMTSAAFVRIGQDEDDIGWRGRRDRFLVEMLPPGAPPAENDQVLRRLASAFDADVSLYARNGDLLAHAGPVVPRPPKIDDGRHMRFFGPDGEHGTMIVMLSDGRVVAARMTTPFRPGLPSPFVYFIVIAAMIGLAAYPVVRHLTRRLERLRLGVEVWGEGALLTRVPEAGRDEVAAVAKSFNRAAERIERLVASHRALLANASHELRSPLARLRMAIDLWEVDPQPRRKDEIVRNLGELDALVEEILLASRLDHVEGLDHVEAVDLLALASEEGARCGTAVSGNAAFVRGDPRLLARLVRNLMLNAQRHGAPPVEALVAVDAGKVRLTVRDHGAGIAPGDSERVFEPFYRPSGRGEYVGGWGLGLALVRQIVRHHGGEVRHEAPADGGTRFVVELPAADAAGELSTAPPASRPR